ncbi:phospholipid phosphatase 2-like [Octopus bimaculoides]|uniref:phospholipid phosphatase 2-like n=1 Tax=Octopus bimaculoides TaxID=37653 RepID=UPI00071E3317|nr:phospholipid phosphatase 2-like [Octopus bimaculoides]|eukprot:XP_014785387.1 PREDICTED: lipid phosphate phosphohydrolase 2-like [Octopus bimaculoides]
MAPITEDITRDICLIISDIICISLVALPCLILELVGKPFQRGFYCNDESIMYPYHDSTISISVLVLVGTGLNITAMIIGECMTHKTNKHYYCLVGKQKKKIFVFFSRLSFASGHSSFAMFSMLFLAIYIHVTLPAKLGSMPKALLELIAISLGIYTCFTRISDYKHHWSDVLAGGGIGIIVCLIVLGKLSDFFVPESRENYELTTYKIPDARSISQASSSSGCETAVTLDNHR